MERDEKAIEEMRAWSFHPSNCKRLIQNVILQSVRDADSLNRKGKLDWVTSFDPTTAPKRLYDIKKWVSSNRFEFWSEYIDLNSDYASKQLIGLLDGKSEVPRDFYRADKR